MAAFANWYEKVTKDKTGAAIFHALEEKNVALLKASKKDLDLLKGVYGE
jgi:hypothetical protein